MENQTALILTRMWMAGETAEAIGNRFGRLGQYGVQDGGPV
jgi:hypothetical protein